MPDRPPPRKTPAAPQATRCCESVGATMIGHFATRLEVEAAKTGGNLSAARIRDLAQRFIETEQARFKGYYQRAWDECSLQRQAQTLESGRRKPFDRILMRRFAHLFPPRTGDDGGEGVLSRRIIPGFNLAIDKMIGPTLDEQCQHKCEAIMARHALAEGGWDWPAIYADADAKTLVNDILVVVAHYFSAFQRRRDWFVEMINSHLAPVEHGAPEESWRLSDSAFSALMRALFTDLHASLRSDPRGARARWGDTTVQAVEDLLRRLD